MNEEDFLKEFGEFKDLFDIVEEPINSKEILLMMLKEANYEFHKLVDRDKYLYYFEIFVNYGGNLHDIFLSKQ